MFLNVGSHDRTIPGFVNLDIEPLGDIRSDVTDGLPIRSGSVEGVHSEHFIEHITQSQAIAFLRECRRVVVDGGRIRVATPDLDFIVARYGSPDWRDRGDMAKHGYDWVATRAEQLNIAMRAWGHQWLYDEDELIRLGRIAGLHVLGRKPMGQSDFTAFAGLEYREGSRLCVEFEKRRPVVRGDDPLVSVLIAAWRPDFLDAAIDTARRQTYSNLEIRVGDDSDGPDVEAICRRHAASDPRITYRRNTERLGGRANYVELFGSSTGDYAKYLNDDDLLEPHCVERMVRCLNALPDVTLVTSHRQLIDESGRPQSDIKLTERPVSEDAVIAGPSAIDMMVRADMNWIGEPTTTMFRRSDIDAEEPDLFSFCGRRAPASVDMTLWMHLLSQGDLCYLTESLSSLRQHPQQHQREAGLRERGLLATEQVRFDATRMGLVEPYGRDSVRSEPLLQKPWWSDDTVAAMDEADMAVGRGEVERGASLLIAALEGAPGDPSLTTYIGALALAVGDTDKGIRFLTEVTRTAPWHVPSHRYLADHALSQGDITTALDHITAILDSCPADADARSAASRLQELLDA